MRVRPQVLLYQLELAGTLDERLGEYLANDSAVSAPGARGAIRPQGGLEIGESRSLAQRAEQLAALVAEELGV